MVQTYIDAGRMALDILSPDKYTLSSIRNVDFREEERKVLEPRPETIQARFNTAAIMHEAGATAAAIAKATGLQRTPDGRWESPGTGSQFKAEIWVDVEAYQFGVRHVVPMLLDDVRRRAETVSKNETKAGYDARLAARYIMDRYAEWKAGQNPTDGETPFAEWSGISKARAEFLGKHGFQSVEQFAAALPQQLDQIPMMSGLRELQRTAQRWLQGKDANAAVAVMKEQDQRIADQQSQIDALMKTVERMGAQTIARQLPPDDPNDVRPLAAREPEVDTDPTWDNEPTPKRGPGRPRKDAVAA